MKGRHIPFLLLLSLGAFAVEGYHPFAEDAEIYLPGVEKILRPALFPFNAEFFESHARLTLFPNLVASMVRISHLPLVWTLFIVQFASIFLLLLGCWQLISQCFSRPVARWSGVSLVAALLTLPVAGTALYILDQYTNPRNLAAFAAIFAISGSLKKKYLQVALWLLLAGIVHPLMSVFALSFCVLLWLLENYRMPVPFPVLALPFTIFSPSSPAYHEAAKYHSFHYILTWSWYEWLGIIAPIALLWWFARVARSGSLTVLERICRALAIYGSIYFFAALVVSIPKSFESLARLQPLRSLHLLYILMILLGGGLLGEYVLKNRLWRWVALFVPLCTGMVIAQRVLFPASAHVEWPWSESGNQWARAFDWVRDNTPTDAIFALDPAHMEIPGEDHLGFRAVAQRSMLADFIKDSGAVSMFPPLADEWLRQVDAERNWKNFQLADFERLRGQYHVDWVVVQTPAIAGLDCQYENSAVQVCRLP